MEEMKRYSDTTSFIPVFNQDDGTKTDLNSKHVSNETKTAKVDDKPKQNTSTNVDSKTTNRFATINVSSLTNMGQAFLESLDKKRTTDETHHKEFQACVTNWANELVAKVQNSVTLKHQNYSEIIAQKFLLISEDIERVDKLEQELAIISKEVEHLFKAINEN